MKEFISYIVVISILCFMGYMAFKAIDYRVQNAMYYNYIVDAKNVKNGD